MSTDQNQICCFPVSYLHKLNIFGFGAADWTKNSNSYLTLRHIKYAKQFITKDTRLMHYVKKMLQEHELSLNSQSAVSEVIWLASDHQPFLRGTFPDFQPLNHLLKQLYEPFVALV